MNKKKSTVGLANNEYVLSRIAGMKVVNKTRYFLIEWEGYGLKDNTWEREDNVYSSSSISAFIEDYCRQSHCRKDSILYMNKKVLLYNTYDPDTKEFYNNPKNPGPVTSVVTENNRKRLRDSSDEESNELSNSTKECRRSLRTLLIDAPKEFQDAFQVVINSVKIEHPVERAANHQRKNNIPLYVIKNLKARVTIFNDVDSDLPNDFIYVDQLQYTSPVLPPDPNFLSGCSCTEASGCSSDCHDSQFYDQKGRLIVPHGTAIYECNDTCDCGENCNNRVVQRGRKIPLQIFKTANKGWGVRTLHPISRGTFVEEYVGEVITTEESNKRGAFYDKYGCSYLFDMDFAQSELPTKYAIDAFILGNVSRFFNHSCSPNLEVFAVYHDSADVQMHRLAFFASRDIKKDEELCFDYNGMQCDTEEENMKHSARYSCHCGAPNCRKWIYI
ncbi:hypothetical protein CU097_002558 [Rhizopus azygosporus]|uniref:Histone-lysine N-methyltransferase n=1 Tax=Rhizopus azygosporus TaxID=86630 RepID=A0A367KD10_RHIAZ|nr:hypothetical protein CU097_002558 [Rhizopus azygosporus]